MPFHHVHPALKPHLPSKLASRIPLLNRGPPATLLNLGGQAAVRLRPQRLSMTRHKMTQLCFRFQPAGRKPPAPQTRPLLRPGTVHMRDGFWKRVHTRPSFSPDSRVQEGLEVDLLTEADFKVKKTILLIYLTPGRNCPWNCTKGSSRRSFTPTFRLVSTAEYESLRVNWSRVLLSSHALRLLGDLSHLSAFHRRVGIHGSGGSSAHTTLQRCTEHVWSLETSLPFPPPRFLHLKNQSKQTMLHPLFYREPLKTSHSFMERIFISGRVSIIY